MHIHTRHSAHERCMCIPGRWLVQFCGCEHGRLGMQNAPHRPRRQLATGSSEQETQQGSHTDRDGIEWIRSIWCMDISTDDQYLIAMPWRAKAAYITRHNLWLSVAMNWTRRVFTRTPQEMPTGQRHMLTFYLIFDQISVYICSEYLLVFASLLFNNLNSSLTT